MVAVKFGIGGAALLSTAPFACAMGVNQEKEKLGIALVGLGSYSTYQLAPALQDTQHCYLVGLLAFGVGFVAELGAACWFNKLCQTVSLACV